MADLIERRVPRRPDLPADAVLEKLDGVRWAKEVRVTPDAVLVTVPRGVAPTEAEFRTRLARDAGIRV